MEKISRDLLEQERAILISELAKLRSRAKDASLYDTALQGIMNAGKEVTCQDFVKNYLKQHNIEVKANGIFRQGNLIRNYKAFFYRLHQDFKEYVAAYSLKNTFSREEVGLEFESILEEKWDICQTALKAKLAPVDNDLEEYDSILTEVAKALCGLSVEALDSVEFRRTKAFIAHFIWQVQMKIHKGPESILKSGNEAMLVLISPQQKTGKSTSVRYLLSPLAKEGFVWHTSLDRLEDKFSVANLAYNYTAFFDDMGKAKSLSAEKFKQIVTAQDISFRAIYTQTEMTLPKLCTFIGTSNKPIRELIHDTTGLRRFHQILVNNSNVYTGKGIDLDTISKIDFSRLYKLTPLTEESPMFLFISPTELVEYEEAIRPKTVTECWLEDMGYQPGGEEDHLMPTRELYQSLRVWASNNGYSSKYIPTCTTFQSKMTDLGYHTGRKADIRGRYVKKL